jgi:hypothetical protein
MKKVVLATFAGGCLLASAATGLAQSTTTIVETTGAAPPDEVVTYVQRERVPSVRVDGDVTVGYAVPSNVELRTIPNHSRYSYTVINDRRVLVEPSTRKVIRVIE